MMFQLVRLFSLVQPFLEWRLFVDWWQLAKCLLWISSRRSGVILEYLSDICSLCKRERELIHHLFLHSDFSSFSNSFLKKCQGNLLMLGGSSLSWLWLIVVEDYFIHHSLVYWGRKKMIEFLGMPLFLESFLDLVVMGIEQWVLIRKEFVNVLFNHIIYNWEAGMNMASQREGCGMSVPSLYQFLEI